MKKRHFTLEQKLAILKEASENGANLTLKNYHKLFIVLHTYNFFFYVCTVVNKLSE